MLAMLAMAGACRGRASPPIVVDWNTKKPEAAALLVLDTQGAVQRVCLPGPVSARRHYPGVALRRVLDVAWKGGPMVAGWALDANAPAPGSGDELVLLVPGDVPRMLARQVRSARFSPDGAALAYEVSPPSNPLEGAPLGVPTSYVLDLSTLKVTRLEGFADPLWEGDSRFLRGTLLRRSAAMPWTSLRARWDRRSGRTTLDGRGSAQVPSPVGPGVAWSDVQRGAGTPHDRDACKVFLNRRGGIPHLLVGRPCMGGADDRGARWSPDGRWLAFTHPGPIPGLGNPGGYFVDVVGPQGGRYPALSSLSARVRPAQLEISAGPGSVFFDWSPSGRFLAVQDGARDLRVYDFAAQGIALLGKGEKPRWSPGGAYLLVLNAQRGPSPEVEPSVGEALVLPGAPPAAPRSLGLVRDARFLPAQACGR